MLQPQKVSRGVPDKVEQKELQNKVLCEVSAEVPPRIFKDVSQGALQGA